MLKTCWLHLEDVFSVTYFCLPRCLEDLLKDVMKMSCEDVLKMSWRCFEEVFGRHLANTSWGRLADVLEDEKLLCWGCLRNVFKTSWKTRNVYWVTVWTFWPIFALCTHIELISKIVWNLLNSCLKVTVSMTRLVDFFWSRVTIVDELNFSEFF